MDLWSGAVRRYVGFSARSHESRLRGTPLVGLLSGPADQHDRRREGPPIGWPPQSRGPSIPHEEVRDHDLVDERVDARRALSARPLLMTQQREEFGAARSSRLPLERHGAAEPAGRAAGAPGVHGRPGRASGAVNPDRAGRTLGSGRYAWRSTTHR